LFEERLGWELYRPIGFDWFHEGYWKIAEPYGNAMDTVGQYLDITNAEWDQYNNLNGNHYLENDVYYISEPVHNYHQRAITLEKFKSMKFDIVMPTIKPHDIPFSILQEKFQPQAKVVAQMGNVRQKTHLNNVLHSVPYAPTSGQNAIYYHQEIDPKIYRYKQPNAETKNIFSMVNCLPYASIYNQYKGALTDAEMKAHGAGCPDGALFGCKGVAEKMMESNIGWHLKPADGFGHTAMGWFASGRHRQILCTRMTPLHGLRYIQFDPLANFVLRAMRGCRCHL